MGPRRRRAPSADKNHPGFHFAPSFEEGERPIVSGDIVRQRRTNNRDGVGRNGSRSKVGVSEAAQQTGRAVVTRMAAKGYRDRLTT
jgi:hypothetical protein